MVGEKSRVAVASSEILGLRVWSQLIEKRDEETYWGDGHVPYLDKGELQSCQK